jgi:putative ATP-dependent endonuclease of the OLD family
LTMQDVEEQIPKELGIRLSSLFMFDRLIFLEGKSDESILRELAARIRVNFAKMRTRDL